MLVEHAPPLPPFAGLSALTSLSVPDGPPLPASGLSRGRPAHAPVTRLASRRAKRAEEPS
ncbi:hypothetical protein TPA0909_29080 [Streptomyces albus]|nr:hypothetical protein TPA0909_29080 [Streptomyces albus]